VSGTEAVTRDTEVLIAGLPRSGNSFAVNAFRLAQGRPVRIAHHEYPPPQIYGAAHMGIPALMIVRAPDDVATSRVVSHPPITLRQALLDSLDCYTAIRPLRDHFVLSDFSEVTDDFGLVIRRLNQHFGTAFLEFDHTESNVAVAFEKIDDRYRAMGEKEQRAFDRMVARPSEERNRAKRAVRNQLESPALSHLRSRARRAYQALFD